MNKLPESLVKFAGVENLNAYEMFRDYYARFSDEVLKKNIGPYHTTNKDGKVISFAEADAQMHKALLAEIDRVSGQHMPENFSEQMWASNPNYQWATFAVVLNMIETILPKTIIDSIGFYTDLRFIGWGDVALFDLPNRALPINSLAGNAQRIAPIQKMYRGNNTVEVTNHMMTMSVDMYRVLSGHDSLAEYARRCVIKMETDLSVEAYKALTAGLTAGTVPSQLHIQGAFDMEDLVSLCQRVEAYNYGMKPVIAGTTLGLMKILPDSAAGYRLNVDASNPHVNLIRTAFGYDFLELRQVATGNYTDFGLALNDDLIMVISPAADKLVRGVIEGATLSHSNDYYQTADLSSNYTVMKRFGFGYLTGAVAGCYELQ